MFKERAIVTSVCEVNVTICVFELGKSYIQIPMVLDMSLYHTSYDNKIVKHFYIQKRRKDNNKQQRFFSLYQFNLQVLGNVLYFVAIVLDNFDL